MTCPICYNDKTLTRTWTCEHEICRECTSNWRNQPETGANCPICREHNLRGYHNIARIANVCFKRTYRTLVYTYHFIKWVCKDLDDFIEENRTINYDSTIQGTISAREIRNEISTYQINLRNRRNIY